MLGPSAAWLVEQGWLARPKVFSWPGANNSTGQGPELRRRMGEAGLGTDIPSVGGAILMRPTASLSLYLQMVGRALRPAPGKQEAVILDHVGNAHRHGLPIDEREWNLAGRRRRVGVSIPIKDCPLCFCSCPSAAQACPDCGPPVPGRRAR